MYQGRLNDRGAPANGIYDLRFAIYDSWTNGNLAGGPLTNAGTGVSNGLFTAQLDFGAGVFNGNRRWLEVAVETNGAGGVFTVLWPRQPITSEPYAIQALNASNAVVAASASLVWATNISGTISLGQLPNAVVTNGAIANGAGLTNLSSVINVINVRNPPFNAKGDGVSDDWSAIQGAITAACLTNAGPVSVYIPEGTYRLTNTLALTTQASAAVGLTGNVSISELFGDGARRTILQFTNASGNGLEFRVLNGDIRHLANFSVHDLAILGPAISGSTNVSGSGYFFGYSPDVPYGGDTTGWNDSIYNCVIAGWRNGFCVTNTVEFTVRNCLFVSNILHCVYLAHADTTRLENNNYLAPVIPHGDLSAIAIERDISGANGTGVLNIGGEAGDSSCVVYSDGGIFTQIGGNFERNNVFLLASNYSISYVEGSRIVGCTNEPFIFVNGGAGGFFASSIYTESAVLFNQIPGANVPSELPIHHALDGNKTNGVFNGSPRVYPPVWYQTPRWTANISLAHTSFTGATALTPTSPSPLPFNSMDGLSINNATAQVWEPIPSGLNTLSGNAGPGETVQFTLMVQGGTGATNATVFIQPIAARIDPVSGYVEDSSPSFNINGITNGMVKTFTWSDSWNSTASDSSPQFLRLWVQTSNQIYLDALTAHTIDY